MNYTLLQGSSLSVNILLANIHEEGSTVTKSFVLRLNIFHPSH